MGRENYGMKWLMLGLVIHGMNSLIINLQKWNRLQRGNMRKKWNRLRTKEEKYNDSKEVK
tara:strand:+ start:154 stop:333 length:180 start_codon:yes stop_codon:yes gene_type:complete